MKTAESKLAIETSRDNRSQIPAKSTFSFSLSERRLLLALIDLVAVNGALFLSLLLRPERVSKPGFLQDNWHWFAILTVVWLLGTTILDAYDLTRAADALASMWTGLGGVLFTVLVYHSIPFITPEIPSRRVFLLAFPVIAAIGVAGWRFLYAKVLAQPTFHRRLLVAGAGKVGQEFAQMLAPASSGPSQRPGGGVGYTVIGFVDEDETKRGLLLDGVPVLGASGDLVRLVGETNPDQLIVAISDEEELKDDLLRAVLACRERGLVVTGVEPIYEQLTGRCFLHHSARDLMAVMPAEQPMLHGLYLFLKGVLDITLGLLGSTLVLAIAPCVALCNLLFSQGSLFYSQDRVGKHGKVFTVHKFRSMVMDAEDVSGAVWAKKEDARVTRVGTLLRKTRLDELPQSWNVLKGEMSVIGPRPERPEFVKELSDQIPIYPSRHAVHPGITGWAQVKFGYASSREDSLLKLQYDLYYIRHQSAYLDALILLRTIPVMLGLKGR